MINIEIDEVDRDSLLREQYYETHCEECSDECEKGYLIQRNGICDECKELLNEDDEE